MHYAGIGSRETPAEVMTAMTDLATIVAKAGYTLRSGGADGADTAFEIGCDKVKGNKEIFIPWRGFNKSQSVLYPATPQAHKLASEIHKGYQYLSPAAKNLIARNMHQVLGYSLNTPVKCVVCWTKDGCEDIEHYTTKTGGTGSAIALASTFDIPVFNLKNYGRLQAVCEFFGIQSGVSDIELLSF